MEKYIIRVNILKSDEKGNMKSEDFEYSFQEPQLITARNNAIAKVKDLKVFFNNEMPEESKFSSSLEAELTKRKNTRTTNSSILNSRIRAEIKYTVKTIWI